MSDSHLEEEMSPFRRNSKLGIDIPFTDPLFIQALLECLLCAMEEHRDSLVLPPWVIASNRRPRQVDRPSSQDRKRAAMAEGKALDGEPGEGHSDGGHELTKCWQGAGWPVQWQGVSWSGRKTTNSVWLQRKEMQEAGQEVR